MSRISVPQGWLTKEPSGWRAHVNIHVPATTTDNKLTSRVHRSEIIAPLTITKSEAKVLKNQWLLKVLGWRRGVRPDPRTTLTSFAESVYFPEVSKKWKPPTLMNKMCMTRLYILKHLGDKAVEDIGATELQLHLNNLSEQYSRTTLTEIVSNLRGIMKNARKRGYIHDDPTEDLYIPQAKLKPKQWAREDQLAALFDAVSHPMDQCFVACMIFLALRSAEIVGMKWKGFDFDSMTYTVSSTAYRNTVYDNNAKTERSKSPVAIDDLILPYIQAWHRICPDPSPEALVFGHTPIRGKNKGNTVPWTAYDYINQRIRPAAKKAGIDPSVITVQVTRRSAIDSIAANSSLCDAQGLGRHSQATTRNYYLQSVPKDVRDASKARNARILLRTADLAS